MAGFIWLHPASREALLGHGAVMIGDGTDSVTIPWQYQVIVDTFHEAPSRLLFGGVYSNQVAYPEGYPVFVPYSERAIVLALAPFMRGDLLPTSVVWVYMALSGLAMHVCARLLGWRRTIAFALGLAWAICPYTRARSVVHNGFVGVYFAPLAVAGLRIAAGSPRRLGWSARTDLIVASILLFCTAGAAHYYSLMLIAFAPAFVILYALFLPRGASRLGAAGRLVLAALPALLLLLWTRTMPVKASDARRFAEAPPSAEMVRVERDKFLKWYGAHASHYVAGDLRFGDRDVIPWRAQITREVARDFPANLHESTNGIRWTVLAASAAVALVLAVKRLRRRLHRDDRRLGLFALALGFVAFLTSLSPQGLRYYDVELAPILLVSRVLPPFRVPNRVGVLVHFAALLATGVAFDALATQAGRFGRRWGAPAVGGALLVLVVVEYLPLHPVLLAQVPIAQKSLVPASGECGAGIMVPYATEAFENSRYYKVMAQLRGTSCKLLHGGHNAPEEPALVASLASGKYGPEDVRTTAEHARCTRASWALFSAGTPAEFSRAVCAELGWSFVSPEACRGAPGAAGEPRAVSQCVPPLSAARIP